MRRRHPRHPRHDLPCAPPSPRRQAKREAEAAKREADERARREESFRFREEGLQKKLKAAQGGAPPGRELFDKSEGSPRSPDQLTGWEQGGGRAKAGVRKSGGVAAGKGGLPKPGAVEAEVRKLKEENERLTEAKSRADAEIRQLRAERDAKRPTPTDSKRGSTNSAAVAAVATDALRAELQASRAEAEVARAETEASLAEVSRLAAEVQRLQQAKGPRPTPKAGLAAKQADPAANEELHKAMSQAVAAKEKAGKEKQAMAKEMGKLEAKLDVKQASTLTIPTTMLSSTQLHTHP